jgi:hypothetical protein
MKKRLILLVSVMLVSVFLGPLVVQKAGAEKKADEKKIEYLYVQTAHAVTFQGDKMTLHGVSPTTLFFSDRPERIVGHGATEEMVKEWSQGEESFAKDPPNAVLSILGGNEEEIEDIVVVLRNPQLNGSQLTYAITLLDGKVPSHGGASALFIDTIGRPLTPLSYAGTARRVARRTTRRAVYRANPRRFYTVPVGAVVIVESGTTYYVVNGIRYIKAIENGQVVYIEVD